MKVFLISGKSASGKDTVARLMQHYLYMNEKRVLVIHFGDLVKTYLTNYYNWNGEKDVWGRAKLQRLGTEQVRTKYPEYWAEVVGKFISAVEEDWDFVLIPDWRFKNEFEIVSSYNKDTIPIRVNRKDAEGKYIFNPSMTKEQIWHQSEIELDDFNFEWIIDNCGTIDDLRENVEQLLHYIGE